MCTHPSFIRCFAVVRCRNVCFVSDCSLQEDSLSPATKSKEQGHVYFLYGFPYNNARASAEESTSRILNGRRPSTALSSSTHPQVWHMASFTTSTRKRRVRQRVRDHGDRDCEMSSAVRGRMFFRLPVKCTQRQCRVSVQRVQCVWLNLAPQFSKVPYRYLCQLWGNNGRGVGDLNFTPLHCLGRGDPCRK
jgi:hypothetical protein